MLPAPSSVTGRLNVAATSPTASATSSPSVGADASVTNATSCVSTPVVLPLTVTMAAYSVPASSGGVSKVTLTVPGSVVVAVAECVRSSGPMATMSIFTLALPVPSWSTGTLKMHAAAAGAAVTGETSSARGTFGASSAR